MTGPILLQLTAGEINVANQEVYQPFSANWLCNVGTAPHFSGTEPVTIVRADGRVHGLLSDLVSKSRVVLARVKQWCGFSFIPIH